MDDHVPSGDLEIIVGGYSTAGRKEHNDDAFVANVPASRLERRVKGVVGCIADGISSSENSHIASQTAVLQFADEYYATPETWSTREAGARVLNGINRWLSAQHRDDCPHASGLITTFSALILKSHTAYILHVGDCRIYVYRKNKISCLTRDHTHTVAGQETILTSVLGINENLRVDYLEESLVDGDLFLLLSDGVYATLNEASLAEFINKCQVQSQVELEHSAKKLCLLAHERGSDDNLSCLFMRIDALPQEDLEATHRRLTHRKIPPALDVGNKIDNYQVERVLHSGTRSLVYLVRDLEDQKLYALKAPSQNFEDNLPYLESFAREQWIGRTIDDPGFMKIRRRGSDSAFLYFISEYIDAPTLRQWMRDNTRPSLTQVRNIIGELIRVVRVLHRAGMVHRDLKPENILLPENKSLKLIDFGTVQVAGLEELTTFLDDDIPQGSVDYIAPETMLGKRASSKSDLFSIGCIAYEMLVGFPPYRLDATARRWPKSFRGWSYKPARYVRDDIPDWVDWALEKAVAPDPKDRYTAMSELEEDLKRPGAWAMSRQEHVSLIDRDPLLFWKCATIILGSVVLLQWLLIRF